MAVEQLEEYVEAVTNKFKSLKSTNNSLKLLVNLDDLVKELEAAENMPKM